MELNFQQPEALSLSQFTARIRSAVEAAHLVAWVVAEISEISTSRGHYYLDLIEKSEVNRNPIAKIRANMWASVAARILPKFVQQTERELQKGMKVMFFVQASFHELYGLSLTILDIDANYTLGDVERQRLETLRRLQDDGVIDMNKQIVMPSALQRLAVISSKTAAGFGDFCNQLDNNLYHFDIKYTLYEAMMQGVDAEATIISALDAIASHIEDYDAVVIIRGGGSKADLACFDGYDLASNIAQFPLPVITGIGHERDNSVADVVANTRMKTPTAVAEFIIAHNLLLLNKLDELIVNFQDYIYNYIENINLQRNQMLEFLNTFIFNYINASKINISHLQERTLLNAQRCFANESNRLKNIDLQLNMSSRNYLKNVLNHIQQLTIQINSINPKRILDLGYTITEGPKGRVRSANDVESGDEIVTITADGKLRSTVS